MEFKTTAELFEYLQQKEENEKAMQEEIATLKSMIGEQNVEGEGEGEQDSTENTNDIATEKELSELEEFLDKY